MVTDTIRDTIYKISGFFANTVLCAFILLAPRSNALNPYLLLAVFTSGRARFVHLLNALMVNAADAFKRIICCHSTYLRNPLNKLAFFFFFFFFTKAKAVYLAYSGGMIQTGKKKN